MEWTAEVCGTARSRECGNAWACHLNHLCCAVSSYPLTHPPTHHPPPLTAAMSVLYHPTRPPAHPLIALPTHRCHLCAPETDCFLQRQTNALRNEQQVAGRAQRSVWLQSWCGDSRPAAATQKYASGADAADAAVCMQACCPTLLPHLEAKPNLIAPFIAAPCRPTPPYPPSVPSYPPTQTHPP